MALPVALALVSTACARKSAGDDGTRPPAPADDATGSAAASSSSGDSAQAQNGPSVVFTPSDGPAAQVAIEVARTPRQIQLGLMYRATLPPDAGMLFLFRKPSVQTFWMKNTLIPLDMIFIGSDMKVVGVVANAEPKTLTSRRVDGESQYVLEVNGGWAKAHGVGPGTPAQFLNVAPLRPGEGME